MDELTGLACATVNGGFGGTSFDPGSEEAMVGTPEKTAAILATLATALPHCRDRHRLDRLRGEDGGRGCIALRAARQWLGVTVLALMGRATAEAFFGTDFGEKTAGRGCTCRWEARDGAGGRQGSCGGRQGLGSDCICRASEFLASGGPERRRVGWHLRVRLVRPAVPRQRSQQRGDAEARPGVGVLVLSDFGARCRRSPRSRGYEGAGEEEGRVAICSRSRCSTKGEGAMAGKGVERLSNGVEGWILGAAMRDRVGTIGS